TMHDTREDIVVELTNPGRSQWTVTPTGECDDDGNPCAAALVFDGDTRGVYTESAVVYLALEYGWKRDGTAEDYLNTITPDGYAFGWDSGSFYLANDAWWHMTNG
ncbi:MAG TPA: hypothetical protein VG476_02515, partial [Acidimicrobiales bacterium]|nr:hypothetical protein [Acidimicrobiales bacterium]